MEFQVMERARIQPSPLNPRKYFDEEKLRELAASMANGVGLIEPLVVRPRPELNCYELIAGERRWRAAEIAGLSQLPVMVKDLTDSQVVEQMLIENGQREDVNPLEEGEGFKLALRLGTFTDVDGLAAHVGMSRRYVYDRLKLVDDLVPEAKELLAKGEISGSHGVILSRLSPEQQAQALDPDYGGVFEHDRFDQDTDADIVPAKPRSVRQLEEWISHRFRFDPTLRVNREIYPETAAVIESAAKVVEITQEHYVHGDVSGDDKSPRILTDGKWHRADGLKGSTKCERAVVGVVVVGRGRGDAFAVCVDKKCSTHWPVAASHGRAGSATGSPASSKKPAAAGFWEGGMCFNSAAERDDHRERQRKEQEARETWKSAVPAIVKACVVKVQSLKPQMLAELVVSASQVDRDYVNDAARMLPKKQDAATVLQALALSVLIAGCSDEYYGPRSFPETAKSIGLDLAPMLKAAQTSAPEVAPKKPKAKPAAKATVKKKAVAVAKDLKKKVAAAGAKKSSANKKAAAA